jgi:hypothetical protein
MRRHELLSFSFPAVTMGMCMSILSIQLSENLLCECPLVIVVDPGSIPGSARFLSSPQRPDR